MAAGIRAANICNSESYELCVVTAFGSSLVVFSSLGAVALRQFRYVFLAEFTFLVKMGTIGDHRMVLRNTPYMACHDRT